MKKFVSIPLVAHVANGPEKAKNKEGKIEVYLSNPKIFLQKRYTYINKIILANNPITCEDIRRFNPANKMMEDISTHKKFV